MFHGYFLFLINKIQFFVFFFLLTFTIYVLSKNMLNFYFLHRALCVTRLAFYLCCQPFNWKLTTNLEIYRLMKGMDWSFTTNVLLVNRFIDFFFFLSFLRSFSHLEKTPKKSPNNIVNKTKNIQIVSPSKSFCDIFYTNNLTQFRDR